jgi:hypothetical protein
VRSDMNEWKEIRRKVLVEGVAKRSISVYRREVASCRVDANPSLGARRASSCRPYDSCSGAMVRHLTVGSMQHHLAQSANHPTDLGVLLPQVLESGLTLLQETLSLD